ncbi:MAG: LuxR C-terminal-related transcriptional regulator, partial [Novosphingobium sp.]
LVWPFDVAVVSESIALAQGRAASLAGSKLREAIARSRIERLTRREREVLAGVADGMSNRLIGEKLAISPRTVEIHRANMLNKMGASHTSEAIRIAIEATLVN